MTRLFPAPHVPPFYAKMLLAMFACALAVCLPQPSSAHSVYITAWIEGDAVCTESSFSTKSRPKNSQVTVLDTAGSVLHEGVTNENGNVCFPLPDRPMELTYVVNAGQGHRAETTLYAEDFSDALGTAKAASARPEASGSAGSPAPGVEIASETAQAAQAAAVDPDLLRDIVRTELRSQLAPLRQTLTAMQTRRPGMLEIFGGIGWIAGLAGVAMMVGTRRKR